MRSEGLRARGRGLLAAGLFLLLPCAPLCSQPLPAPSRPAPVGRLGTLSGFFRSTDPRTSLPPVVTLRVLEPLIPYPGRQPRRRLFRCSLVSRATPSDRGAWSCALPAATYDLAVGAEGFVPQRRQGVVVLPGRDREMGTFVLEPSQSITGWLAIDEGIFDPGTFLLRVVPPDDAAALPASVYQGDPLLVERTVRSDGAFRITNVRPGTWTVEARSPGFVTAVRTGVVVPAEGTARLQEPLLLRRPFDVELAVEPPLDSRGRPWEIWVGSTRDDPARKKPRFNPQRVERLEPVGRGLFRVPGQVAGRFAVNVTDADGSVFARRDDLEIIDRSEARRTIRVDRLAFEGTVTRVGRPVEGDLYLSDISGGAFVHLRSGPDGRFAGWLTKPGLWSGTFYRDESHESRFRLDVAEDHPDPLVVDIRLPDTRVFGRLEDEQGAPVGQGEVRYRAQGQSGRLIVDEGGNFAGEGLPEGRIWLRAVPNAWDALLKNQAPISEVTEVVLKDGHPVGPLVLRLRPTLPFAGRVVVAGPPGGGAPDRAVWLDAVLDDGFAVSGRLDEDGRFSFELPAGEERITLLLMPENGPLQAAERDPGKAQPEVRLEPQGGTLHVDFGPIWGEAKAEGKTLEVEQDGVLIPLERLLYWGTPAGSRLSEEDDSLEVRALAPGHYRVCLGPEGFHERIDPAARRKTGLDCATGTLEAGGVLRLSLP